MIGNFNGTISNMKKDELSKCCTKVDVFIKIEQFFHLVALLYQI